MIEISPTNRKPEEKNAVKSKRKAGSVSKAGHSFSSELENQIAQEYGGSIDELMNDLKDQEKRFLQKQSYDEMVRYKALVKKILKTILEEGFTKATFKRNKRDRADFTIIQTIDAKLAEISRAVTQSNRAFELMKTIEEIRGLIFDLVY